MVLTGHSSLAGAQVAAWWAVLVTASEHVRCWQCWLWNCRFWFVPLQSPPAAPAPRPQRHHTSARHEAKEPPPPSSELPLLPAGAELRCPPTRPQPLFHWLPTVFILHGGQSSPPLQPRRHGRADAGGLLGGSGDARFPAAGEGCRGVRVWSGAQLWRCGRVAACCRPPGEAARIAAADWWSCRGRACNGCAVGAARGEQPAEGCVGARLPQGLGAGCGAGPVGRDGELDP